MVKIKVNSETIDALGLSMNEKKVFEALLAAQMAGTIARVARGAEMPRMTVSDVLKRLEKRNLASRNRFGVKDYWHYAKRKVNPIFGFKSGVRYESQNLEWNGRK
jgi:predicted transcriptional regulator